MALQQVGQQDEAKARDDKALIKDRAEDAEIELNELRFKKRAEGEKQGQAGRGLPDEDFSRVHVLGEPLEIDLAHAEQRRAGENEDVAQEVLKFVEREAFGKDEHHAEERQDHADHFARADFVPRDKEVGEQGSEEGIGRDEDGGAAGQGVRGAHVEQVDLRKKNDDEAEDAALFVAFEFQVEVEGPRPKIDDDPAEQKAHARKAQRRDACQAEFDGHGISAPEDCREEVEEGGAGVEAIILHGYAPDLE